MKFGKAIQFFGLNLFLAALVLFTGKASAVETNPVRLAVGSFFAPPDNEPLQKTAVLLPDLLTVSFLCRSRWWLVDQPRRETFFLRSSAAPGAGVSIEVEKIGTLTNPVANGRFYRHTPPN